jgi:transketolase
MKFIKRYLDYRLRKFCVKCAAKARSGHPGCTSENAAFIYEFITDKIYIDPHRRRAKEQEQKT